VLPSRQPTFVKLSFKNMNSSSSFQVRLSSSDSLDIFPQNTAANFRVLLPRELSLLGNQWEVALSTIHYPSNIDPSPFLSPQDFWIRLEFASELVQWKPSLITFEPAEVVSGEAICKAITDKVHRLYGEDVLMANMMVGGRMQYEAGRLINLQLSPLFAMVAAELDVVPPKSSHAFTLLRKQKVNLPSVVNLSRCLPQNLLIYSDVISPVISGGKYCNVLKLIPIPLGKRANNYTTYVSRHLDYADVASDRVQSMQFNVRAATGEDVVFTDQPALCYVTLVFRRKIK
jgi:hypothetical protein